MTTSPLVYPDPPPPPPEADVVAFPPVAPAPPPPIKVPLTEVELFPPLLRYP